MKAPSRIGKVSLVVGGYVAALMLAVGAVAANNLFTTDPNAASSGMAAFGDSILFIAVFGLVSLLPTGAAVYFVFSRRRK